MAATVSKRRAGGVRTFWEDGSATAGSDDIVDTSVDNDSAGDVSKYDYFTVYSLTGTFQVFVSLDGTNFSDAISLTNLCDVTGTDLATSVANQVFGFQGSFRHVKVTSTVAVTAFTMIASKLT